MRDLRSFFLSLLGGEQDAGAQQTSKDRSDLISVSDVSLERTRKTNLDKN